MTTNMVTVRLDITAYDLPYFDKFLNREMVKPPVNSLRTAGQYKRDLHAYQRTYEIGIKKDKGELLFKASLSATKDKISPLVVSIEPAKHNFSEKELQELFSLLISRIREAEKLAKEKPVKTFDYEARLSTSIYPLKSSVKFDKYLIIPSDKKGEQGHEFKLKFVVDAIDKDFSFTDAMLEAKIIAAWLSLIFNIVIRFEGFSEIITTDVKPIVNYEKIKRPDFRPVKHSFAEELKIPHDFFQLWKNFYSLPPEVRNSFVASCMCYQAAMDMRRTYPPLSYQLFVTAVEVISKETMKCVGVQKRFTEFICTSVNRQSQRKFIKILESFYSRRSAIVHEKGIGFGFIPSAFDFRSFEEIPAEELWDLEITVNAALIGFLKKPFKMVLVSKNLLTKKTEK